MDSAPFSGVDFTDVQEAEVEALRARRAWVHVSNDRPQGAGTADVAETGGGLLKTWNTVGLCLSGGGIRSSTFGLGVLQALDKNKLINQFDYLSTVSGGGYIGSALTSTLQQSRGQFVFGGRAVFSDTDGVGHLRNYSNYLLPRSHSSFRNAAEALAVVGRGLVTNAVIVSGFVLILAIITVIAFPDPHQLHASLLPRFIDGLFGGLWPGQDRGLVSHAVSWLPAGQGRERRFALTEICLVVLLATEVLWAWRRSTADWKGADVRGPLLRVTRTMIGITALVAFLDLQPVLIDLYLNVDTWMPRWVQKLSKFVLVPTGIVATLATFLSGQISSFIKSTQTSGRRRVVVTRFLVRAVIVVAAIFVPLMLEFGYVATAGHLMRSPDGHRILAAVIACVLLGVSWFFKPNANSLHRFYRDRLSKAFHFEQVPVTEVERKPFSLRDIFVHDPNAPTPSQMREARGVPTWTAPNADPARGDLSLVLEPRDPIGLTALDSPYTPYHLINATLNLQASLHANKRGRDCDFFFFTPKHYGGPLLRFHPVESLKTGKPDSVDLATAVAISGAAASSAMGSLTLFKILAPTLALLNIRLGFWLPNPNLQRAAGAGWWARLKRAMRARLYLSTEMLGFLDEASAAIYLTDGGHIENLGLYELLRRGCKVIVAIDAEADPDITCAALIKAERYARIDLGIRIDIAVDGIVAANRTLDRALDEGRPWPAANGPHAAIGRIRYPNGTQGVLLYVKAALTGDEADYVLRYKKEYPAFPHENTGDQFFSEEQFECYRALGFHCVDRLLDRTDPVACRDSGQARDALWADMWQTLMHAR